MFGPNLKLDNMLEYKCHDNGSVQFHDKFRGHSQIICSAKCHIGE
jgi:hypothetical protein